ncbi:MAG: hypothetical protein LBR11_05960 [Deltaproteobacteria bacterium]|jgi:hypothetical protein|nr:hypothetical protein [Deltaproteobacteria bacterium]
MDRFLAKAAKEALRLLELTRHADSFNPVGKEFIDLALATYDYGDQIKAVFAPKTP